MVINELRLNPNEDSLAHVLHGAGYKSAMIGKWHLWRNSPNHLIVGTQFVPPGPYRLGFDDYWAAHNFWHDNYRMFYFEDSPTPRRINGYETEHYTALALDYIKRKVAAKEPFNLMLSLSPPHNPWANGNVPEKWYEKFSNVEFELPKTWSDQPDPRMDRNTNPQMWREYWKPRLLEFMRVYYAMVASVDEQVGRILQALDELGVDDDTIVVFTSDHGEMFGAHGRIFQMTFYEESARVPFLIRWRGMVPAGLKSDAAMSIVDVMPTLLGLMSEPIPRQVEGMDLSHLAQDKPGPEPEFALLQGMGHTYLWKDGFEWRALRDRRYTYARYLSDGKELLFDNVADPLQTHDIASDPQHAKKLQELRNKLNGKMVGLGDEFRVVSWCRDRWTKNRVILRGAKGEFHRELNHDLAVDVDYESFSSTVPILNSDSRGDDGDGRQSTCEQVARQNNIPMGASAWEWCYEYTRVYRA